MLVELQALTDPVQGGPPRRLAAGFDPHVRVGVVRSAWRDLTATGVLACRDFDYREIEAAGLVTYIHYERPALEALLAEKASHAIFIEAWGESYFRNHRGLHQVHSRRASCSVLQDSSLHFA